MKRWTIRISLLLFIGWVLNVASGWVCERFAGQEWMDGGFATNARREPAPPETGAWIEANAPDGFLEVLSVHRAQQYVVEATVPGVKCRSLKCGFRHLGASSILRHRVGWPLKSMESYHWFCANMVKFRQDQRAVFKSDEGVVGTSPWNLRIAPLWLGTIGNTLFYAVILFGLFHVRAAKRSFRRHRGACFSCGYDLQGDLDAGCPECGWGRIESDH